MYCTYLLQGREEEGVGALSSESIFFHKRAHEYRRVDNKMPLNHHMLTSAEQRAQQVSLTLL